MAVQRIKQTLVCNCPLCGNSIIPSLKSDDDPEEWITRCPYCAGRLRVQRVEYLVAMEEE